MSAEWRKTPQNEREYNAYRQGYYSIKGCDHHGPYCKCDVPFWLRPSTQSEILLDA